jgi:hypothetical protein
MDQAAIAPYYQGLEGIYAPQRANIQQQQEQLNTEGSAALSGLEQAKVNAFRDISSKARGMGVAFGGYSPSEQARYTGATYLPAVGNLKSKQLSGLSALQQALNSIYGNQQTQAMGLYSDAQAKAEQRRQWEAEQAAAAARFQAEQVANERQFQRQMQADAANRAASASRPTAAEAKAQMQSEMMQSIGNAFNAKNASTKFYTERTVLPALYADYAPLGVDAVNKAVYTYRKNALGY